jgi:hypothetical protein
MQGAEVTTKEEVHCLAFFENSDTLGLFQEYLDANLPDCLNEPAIFGYQVQVDENEVIVYEEKRLLINAISKSINEIEIFVHTLNGIFIPAHIDRKKNSLYSQLGFLPESMNADALEVSIASSPEQFSASHPEITKFPLIRNSDAHFPGIIGAATTLFNISEQSFSEIKLALKGLAGRNITTE